MQSEGKPNLRQLELEFGGHRHVWAAMPEPARRKVVQRLKELILSHRRPGEGVKDIDEREDHP